jgi:putative transposase
MASAAVDTFFKTIKAELIWRRRGPTRLQTQIVIHQYIDGLYNLRCRNSHLGGISPLALQAKAA